MERATKVLQARNLSAYLHVDVILLRHNFNWDKDLITYDLHPSKTFTMDKISMLKQSCIPISLSTIFQMFLWTVDMFDHN